MPNPNKFEGISTQQSDFQSPSGVSKLGVKVYERVQSFKPAELIRGSNASKSAKDDRTFGTETQAGFGVKVMPVCPVVARHTRPDHKADDGHFYYAETPAAVQQTA